MRSRIRGIFRGGSRKTSKRLVGSPQFTHRDSLEDIDASGATAFLVPAHSRARKRINITLPEWLISQIDNAATASGTSRSGLIEEAAKEKLTGTHG